MFRPGRGAIYTKRIPTQPHAESKAKGRPTNKRRQQIEMFCFDLCASVSSVAAVCSSARHSSTTGQTICVLSPRCAVLVSKNNPKMLRGRRTRSGTEINCPKNSSVLFKWSTIFETSYSTLISPKCFVFVGALTSSQSFIRRNTAALHDDRWVGGKTAAVLEASVSGDDSKSFVQFFFYFFVLTQAHSTQYWLVKSMDGGRAFCSSRYG